LTTSVKRTRKKAGKMIVEDIRRQMVKARKTTSRSESLRGKLFSHWGWTDQWKTERENSQKGKAGSLEQREKENES